MGLYNDFGRAAKDEQRQMKNNKVHSTGTAALTRAALGIVYGDIGTSPLYAV